MYELLRVFRMLPMPIRFLGVFFLLIPVVIILSRALGMGNKWWLFALVLLVIILLLVGFNALVKAREKRRARQFEGNLASQGRDTGVAKEEIREALAELSEKWQEAVKQLRGAGLSLYDLPWFLLIGEPQSGKSTTLQKSGIEFPVGTEALSGSGGTRNCDWWFCNEAVILDTAGRFTFQEESAPDRHEWSTFLKLLRKYRRNCPINGVIVVIPTTSLVEDTPDEQEKKAKNIRQKLLHLQKVLELRFPVFILVTKADRILGFAEFCSQLDPVDQRQLFGWSNPEQFDKPWEPRSFEAVWDDLVRRVHKFRLRFLREEANLSQIDKLFVFPEELAALKEPLANYLQNVFAASRFEEPFIFRGFYITSGIQQGRPIARACRDLLRVQVGDPQGVVEDLEQVFRQSRAYFIRDFYEKKVFREQGLIARTRAAMKRDNVLRWVYRGLMAATVIVALLLILPARSSLSNLIQPIQRTAEQASRCLDKTQPCGVGDAWALVRELEREKSRLEESHWLWVFLRGRERNEISGELLPTIQGRLLRDRVLPPLLASFETRAGALKWEEHRDLYPQFYDGFQQLLRFRELAGVRGPERQDQLLPDLAIGSVMAFCRGTPGLDGSTAGKEIDSWLAHADVDPGEADTIFRAAARARPADVVVPAPVPDGSRAAFGTYWSMRNLAWWEWTLIDYFQTYMRQIQQIAALDPGAAPTGNAVLTDFAAAAGPFSEAFKAASEHMKSPRQNASGERPGRTVDDWVRNCNADYGRLRQIADSVATAQQVSDLCQGIPGAWQQLLGERSNYQYLYEEKPGKEGAPATIDWSAPARGLAEPLVQLADEATPTAVGTAHDELQRAIAQRLGDRERLDALAKARSDGENRIMAPVQALESLADTSPPRELDAYRVARAAREVAATALAITVLPAADDFFSQRFDTACADCFEIQYARDFVPAANTLLSWSRGTLQPALGNAEVNDLVRKLSDAEYDYVAEFVHREAAAAGGGVPGGFQRPISAARADGWRSFVTEIRRWEVISQGRPARTSSGGLSASDLQQWARDNDRLRGLARDLESRLRRASSGREPQVPKDLEDAANRFKRTVAGLEDDALKAWQQLATGQRGASLDDFHVFSEDPRLRDNSEANWLARNVEEHGAELLSREITPQFNREFTSLWRLVDSRLRGHYPFITERELSRQRQEYLQGYQGTRGGVWAGQTVDSGRRQVINAVALQTVSLNDIDSLFYEGGLDRLFDDFALDPIISGREKQVNFIGGNRDKLQVLRQWQQFLYGTGGTGGPRYEPTSEPFKIKVRLLPWQGTSSAVFLGTRMAQVDVFDRSAAIRPSTDANRNTVRDVAVRLDEGTLSITGINEDLNGWTGQLDIRGGPLKLFYFVQIASTGRPRQDGRIWSAEINLPDFEKLRQPLEGTFEIAFERPVPGVFADLEVHE